MPGLDFERARKQDTGNISYTLNLCGNLIVE